VSGGGKGENLEARFGHGNRMLELGGEGFVPRHGCPSVVQRAGVVMPGVDHRFDGEEHPRLQHRAVTCPADMEDRRGGMENPPEAMAAEIAHHGKPSALRNRLNGVADIAERRAGFHRIDPGHHRIVCNIDKAARLLRDFIADQIHPAGIAVPPIQNDGHVDVDDIALDQRLLPRDPVADDMVDGRADGFGEGGPVFPPAIPKRRRDRPVAGDEIVAELIQRVGPHPRNDMGRDHVERGRRQLSGAAHAFKIGRIGVKRDPVLRFPDLVFRHLVFGLACLVCISEMTYIVRAMTASPKSRQSALLIIGNEILSGRTQDTNTAFIALRMNDIGIPLSEVRVVPDIEQEIVESLNALRAKHDIVFTTGGIGPTHDDITAASVAKAFGVSLALNPQALQMLVTHYGGAEHVTPPRRKMAMIPDGATLIPNPVSGAPGFTLQNVHVMAGVPKIMQAMLDNVLATLTPGAPVLSRTVACALPESAVADALAALQARYPNITIGSYPQFRPGGVPGLSVVLRGTDGETIDRAEKDVHGLIGNILSN